VELATLQMLFRYNRWANEQVFAATPAASFTRDLGEGLGTVRDTLTHIVWSEWIWLQRWHGVTRLVFQPADFAQVPPGLVFVAADFPTVDSLHERSRAVADDTLAFVSRLDPERLLEVTEYLTVTGEPWPQALWRQLLHAVTHSTYHRGQVATKLRQLGHTPAATDFVAYRE
jgi:uncharacterized damage-inducible protein DinB